MSEKWNIGLPGGPAGPFYSIVSSSGRIIALQIPDRQTAEEIVSLRARAERAEAALKDIVEQSKFWGEMKKIDGLDFTPPQHQVLANIARKALKVGEG